MILEMLDLKDALELLNIILTVGWHCVKKKINT